jgi:hypothetical protein
VSYSVFSSENCQKDIVAAVSIKVTCNCTSYVVFTLATASVLTRTVAQRVRRRGKATSAIASQHFITKITIFWRVRANLRIGNVHIIYSIVVEISNCDSD